MHNTERAERNMHNSTEAWPLQSEPDRNTG
jgi:hypothetical protein